MISAETFLLITTKLSNLRIYINFLTHIYILIKMIVNEENWIVDKYLMVIRKIVKAVLQKNEEKPAAANRC